MTTVAMVAGMLPTAISLTGDGSWRAPMGMTVIGGLIFSTILTLLLVPACFIDGDRPSRNGLARGMRDRLIDNGRAHASSRHWATAPLPAE